MALTGNKGEWSEIYVLFKLLGEGVVYAGDGALNRLENLFYPILKVLRDEKKDKKENRYEYSVQDDLVVVSEDGSEILRKNVHEFLTKAKELYQVIHASKGVFAAPEIESFMEEIHCSTLKAKSTDKADIHIVIHDLRTGMTPTLGFSIKSQIGNNSTLLNAGKTTNFRFRIEDYRLNEDEKEEINNIETRQKVLDRVKAIIHLGGSLRFVEMEDKTCRNNFVLIDSLMPEIIARILLQAYSTGEYDLKNNTIEIAKSNPMGYDMSDNQSYYEHKVKNLLVASALGMVPHKPWNGRYEANGGYLVVKEDGDVLCYHFYDRNLFEDYLFENTKLETASTGRHDFGMAYRGEDGEYYFNLNLQIRFK